MQHRSRHPIVRPMRTLTVSLVVVLLAAGLAACSGGSLLDQKKRAPDEFTVYSRAPLSLPPGYALRPPQPGTTVADTSGPRTEARSALIGGAPAAGGGFGPGSDGYGSAPTAAGGTDAWWPGPDGVAGADDAYGTSAAYGGAGGIASRPTPSAGAEALLVRTGANEADPAIRDFVNRETAILAEADKSFVERLIFWGTPTEYGTVVDPVEERRRIKENQALGRTVTAGTTPTIERQRRAILQGLFN